MGKLVYLIGRSSSGKDTIFKRLMEWDEICFQKVVTYTTRPIRANEKEGEEYHFTDESGYLKLEEAGKVIESRVYDTCHGLWRYFTADDGSFSFEKNNYLIIGTLESFNKTADYFGRENVLPVLLELDDGIRLQRALQREMEQEQPKYEELCRRFLADAKDFSPENVQNAGITKTFNNDDLERCLLEIKEYIRKEL